jgi:hypothetical protein
MSNKISVQGKYTLPSLGKVYDTPVNPEVTLRSMTTNEEMKRLNHSDRPYAVISEIIDDCLVEDPGISAYDMCMGDYQFLLHRLRMVTYGSDYKTVSRCPFCYSTNSRTIDLNSLEVNEYDASVDKYLEFDLPRTKKHIKLRMQTPRMLDTIAAKTKEFKKKAKGFTGDAAFLFTIQMMVDTVDGKKLDAIELEDFARSLPMMDANYIIKYSDKLNEKVGLNPVINIDCDHCGLDYDSPFRITSEFFGPSIDI